MVAGNTDHSDKVMLCERWSEEIGRFGGWHHHEGPHGCDCTNHDGECLYWRASVGDPTPNLRQKKIHRIQQGESWRMTL